MNLTNRNNPLSSALILIVTALFCQSAVAVEDLPLALPAVAESGLYSAEELAAVNDALAALGMTTADLEFEKKWGGKRFLLDIVGHLLDNPLDNPIYLKEFDNAWQSVPDRAESVNLLFQQLDVPAAAEALTVPAAPDSPEEWRNALSELSVASADAEALMALPEPFNSAVGLICAALPVIERDIAAAFANLSQQDLHKLHVWSLVMGAEDGAENLTFPIAGEEIKLLLEVDPEGEPAAEATEYLDLLDKVEWGKLRDACVRSTMVFDRVTQLLTASKSELPELSQPLSATTRLGIIMIGTAQDDHYASLSTVAALIEPGGSDVYDNCHAPAAFGPRVPASFMWDLGGDDVHRGGETDFTLAASLGGAALFYDAAGDDVYSARNLSQGCALLGAAWFEDAGGRDSYRAGLFSQAAAITGAAALVERADSADDPASANDSYTAAALSQAASMIKGIAVLDDAAGNDTYSAGGVRLHAPLYSDRYQSLSQGFSIGMRPDAGGGLAFLIDRSGNDRYLGEVYGQGAGYWYGAGFLLDQGGNDNYQLTIYGQGAGIHLACGTLIDEAGHDGYYMNDGLGQGGSHDYANGVLLDWAGNDEYVARGASNQGRGLTNAVGLFIDRAGDDLYASHSGWANGAGRAARGFGSIGIFADMAGQDRYSLQGANGLSWTSREYGTGIDRSPEPSPAPASNTASNIDEQPESDFEPPRPGEKLTRERFDQLWDIAIEWEVGANSKRVPAARQALASFGPPVLKFLEPEIAANDGGLCWRGITKTCELLLPKCRADVVHTARKLLKHKELNARRAGIGMIEELNLQELAPRVLQLIDDDKLRRPALRAAGVIGAAEAIPQLRAALGDEEAATVLTAAEALAVLHDEQALPQLITLLDHADVTVRMALIDVLPRFGAAAGKLLIAEAEDQNKPERLRINALQTIALLDGQSRESLAGRIAALSRDSSWAIRARVADILRHLLTDSAALAAWEALQRSETQPAVRYILRENDK